VTGSLFFVPSADFLEDLPDPPTAAEDVRVREEISAADGSLGIGDLKGSSTR
jgi:putative iron-dependent peroxidase